MDSKYKVINFCILFLNHDGDFHAETVGNASKHQKVWINQTV